MNKFEKIITIMFTCALAIGFNINAHAASFLSGTNNTTTNAAVQVTTSSEVTTTSAAAIIDDIYITPLNAITSPDKTIPQNTFSQSSDGVTYFYDENGYLFIGSRHKGIYKYLRLIRYNDTVYCISDYAEAWGGWKNGLKDDWMKGLISHKYKSVIDASDYYYTDKDGIVLANTTIDGYIIGADGRVINKDTNLRDISKMSAIQQ